MKALIISFFCIILGYSFFFDKKEESKVLPSIEYMNAPEVKTEKMGEKSTIDTVDFYANQRTVIFLEKPADQIF